MEKIETDFKQRTQQSKLHRGVGQTLFRAKTHNARHVLIQCIAVVSINLCQQLLFLRSESQSGINKERMNIDTKGYVKRIVVIKKVYFQSKYIFVTTFRNYLRGAQLRTFQPKEKPLQVKKYTVILTMKCQKIIYDLVVHNVSITARYGNILNWQFILVSLVA